MYNMIYSIYRCFLVLRFWRLTFDGDQASCPGFGWHQDVPVTWHGLEFPNFEWGISGKDLAERCGISLGIFHGFFSNMWNNHGFFHGFSMAFPPLFLCFSGFCKWTGCACWGDPLGSARRSWAGPGEQLPWRDGFYIPCGKLTYLWNITIFKWENSL